MGILDRLLGRSAERLPTLPEEALILDIEKLSVRTAGELVILTVDTTGAQALIDASSQRAALQLRGPGRNVTLVPTRREERIALDPEHGWIIPATAQRSAQLAAIDAAPGEYELGGLAVVVE